LAAAQVSNRAIHAVNRGVHQAALDDLLVVLQDELRHHKPLYDHVAPERFVGVSLLRFHF